ncbi:MAG: hypothetical protein KDE27_12350 [Planctomycetes bacterium]|nr:hypothetical protein [Planctomycetota bacterium]
MIAHGAAVWVVDSGARTVTVYGEVGNRMLTDADSLAGGSPLPGFEVEVAVAESLAVE